MTKKECITIGERRINLYLPPSYFTSNKRYPIVYVQDGGELFKQCANHLNRLFLEGWLPELILAGVETPDREAEYRPWSPAEAPSGSLVFCGKGRAYVDELADRIKPYLDNHYRTDPNVERTSIIGSSMGGLITLFTAYSRPDAFGNIGLLSPSLGHVGLMAFLREQPALSDHLRIFLSVGAQEGMDDRTVPRNVVHALELCKLWQAQGIPDSRLAFQLDEEGTDDTLFIVRQFPQVLLAFYGQEAERPPIPSRAKAENSVTTTSTYEIPRTETFILRAERTGLSYRILVSEPMRSPPAEGYPVLYALDGNAHFGSMTEALRMQSWHPHGLTPGLIVAIGYDSDEPFVYGRRLYDFTVETPESDVRSDGMVWPPTGGADFFLTFLEEELLPFIQSRYPVDVTRQSLFGHSLGGLFSLYALFNRPSPFRTFIAGSPSIYWNDYDLLRRLPAFEERLVRREIQAELIIAIGSEEDPSMIENATLLYQRLQPYENRGLNLSYMLIEGEEHLSVIHPMISKIFKLIFHNAR
ncbi:alpha/beta hydrolase [Paenibacillus sinopodophylli]|uniref:alpha/beta hydrolase n=1 Tax=Paenibacillus sinopodophylli TaxID=1837342 RepID=UPI00110C9A81|nr:alpha/beta hydrolase-fold protein [Paenibacillus sinopodophylli]